MSYTHNSCVYEKYHLVGVSVLRGDAVIRAMMWLVACHKQVQGTCVWKQ